MKAFLMFPDRDFDVKQRPPWNDQALLQDLELTTLLDAIAQNDEFLFAVAKSVVFSAGTADVRAILYRQDILKDCLRNSDIV
jgi:hypothetical protein